MESQVSPKNIEARVEKMAAESTPKPVETPAAAPVTPEAAKPATPAPEAATPATPEPAKPAAPVAPEAAKPAEPVKPVEKTIEKKQPNDPAELRKWSTKLSQENSQLREKMDKLEAAISKLSKKPVDYAAIAKDPESLKAHIEQERAEAVAELQKQLQETNTLAIKNETTVEKMRREQDKENYPKWEKLFPRIQTLAAVSDGRVNWNQAPGLALDEAYALADWLEARENPTPAAAAPAPVVPTPAAAPAVTEEQIQARIAEAVTKAKAEAEANLRAEGNGAGIGSGGRGGRRDVGSTNEALKTMPLKDLKKIISKE